MCDGLGFECTNESILDRFIQILNAITNDLNLKVRFVRFSDCQWISILKMHEFKQQTNSSLFYITTWNRLHDYYLDYNDAHPSPPPKESAYFRVEHLHNFAIFH